MMVAKGDAQYARSTNVRITTPEAYGQCSHEKGMSTEIGSHGKVGIEKVSTACVLHSSQMSCFPSDYRKQLLSYIVAPFGQFTRV